MNNIQYMVFETVAKRALYGMKLIYSDFQPIEADNSSEQDQKKLHETMGLLVEKLNENPSLLSLPDDKDEAYQVWEVNNLKPELDKVYQTIFKSLFEFYKFLYITALHGEIEVGGLTISAANLKAHKAACKPVYKTLLNDVGIEFQKEKESVSIIADAGMLRSLKLLAEKVPVNVNKWTPFVLSNFACCSFTGNFDYLLARTDDANNLDGLLFTLQKEAAAKGYTQSVSCSMTATSTRIAISFSNGVGGFLIHYNPRKYKSFQFGTANGIGEKAMLEDFDNLDEDLQKHFIDICRPCNGCRSCVKGGKNKMFTTTVNYKGTSYNLCPCFPRDSWDRLDRALIDLLFKYHDAQNAYDVDRKKK